MFTMFVNYTTDQSWGEPLTESIPAERFEITHYSRASVILAVVMAILMVIGITLMSTQPVHSNLFWAGTGSGLVAFSSMIILAIVHKVTNQKHQNRMLHHSQNPEQYLTLLAADQGVHYTFRLPQYVKESHQQTDWIANKKKETSADIGRARFCIEGVEIQEDEIFTKFGERASYANQASLGELTALVKSRYNCRNDHVHFELGPRELEKDKSDPRTCFNLLSNGDVLEAEQLFRIRDVESEETIKYLRGKITIDFRTGDAVCTWSSPQDEYPRF